MELLNPFHAVVTFDLKTAHLIFLSDINGLWYVWYVNSIGSEGTEVYV